MRGKRRAGLRRGLLGGVTAGLLTLAAGTSAATTPAARPAVALAASAQRAGCPAGTQAEGAANAAGATAGYPGLPGEPARCVALGGPESPGELTAMQQQAAAPWTAGSGPVPAGAYAAALAARQAMAASTSGGGSWSPVGHGPLSAAGNYDQVGTTGQFINALGLRNLTGRITDISYDPAVPGRIFASAAEGGVWESRDAGATWTSIGDTLVTQSVGAIAWDTVGGGTLVVATGDNAQGRYNYGGHGVYFSHDDGHTWVAASPNVLDGTENFRVAVSPNDPHRLYVANSRGLYQGTFTADGSQLSLRNVHLPTGHNPDPAGPDCGTDAGAAVFPNCFLANNVTDVQVRAPGGFQPAPAPPAGADEVIANVGSRFGNHFYETPDGSASLGFKQTPTAGIYRSATGAPGTFTHLAPTGFPTSDHVGRVSLNAARGPNQGHGTVYALVHDPVKEDSCFDDFDVPKQCQKPLPTPIVPTPGANLSTVLDGLYYSSDFGDSWTKVMDWSQLDQPGTNSAIGGPGGQDAVGYGPGIQSSYNNWVLIDPTQADTTGRPTRLLFGLEEIWENNPAFVGPGNPATTDFLTQQKAFEAGGANDPWKVIGRYWNSCGPFTFGEGFNCNGTEAITGGTTTHPDQHASLFVPTADGVTLYAGSDGGLFKQSTSAAHPQFDNESWGDGISGNLMALQPYNAEISKDGTVAAGLQDNGEMKINPDGSIQQIYGGDGFYSSIDPNNSKNIVEEYVYGRTAFTQDGGVTWSLRDPGLSSGCAGCARFDTPFQMDPNNVNNFLIAGRTVYDRVWGFGNPGCVPFSPADPNCLVFTNASDWDAVYDLGTGQHPGDASQSTSPSAPDANNSSTAVDVRGDAQYVGFCAQCDLILEGNPFSNGIATNVGGSAPAKFDTGAGWHIASMRCGNCKTAAGAPMPRLPRRYITSVRIDPTDVNTIYVTLGGYQRVWIQPGAFGEANPFIGQGHVFKSTNHGEDFTDITGNLPNTPALFSLVHNGHLEVATDIGVFESADTNGGSYSVLGASLPATPVDTIRLAPGNPDLMIAATWGRGVWSYCFTGGTCPVNVAVSSPTNPLPNTAAGFVGGPLVPLAAVALVAGFLARRRSRPA